MKKRKIDVAVLSDVRLGDPECHAEEVIAYLSSITPGTLVLNGMLLDRPAIRSGAFPTSHYKVIKKIFSLAARGTRVYWVEERTGRWPNNLQEGTLGDLEVLRELILKQEGQKTWIFHQNLLGPLPGMASTLLRFGKTGRFLLSILRRLGGRKAKENAGLVKGRRMHEKQEAPTDSDGKTVPAAARFALRKNFNTVICGSTATPTKKWLETPQGSCLYLSGGSWHHHLSTFEFAFKRWKIYFYCQDKLSPFYADEDLKGMNMNELLSDLEAKDIKRRKAALGSDD